MTSRDDALESNALDSFDYRAWMTLAKSLERRLLESSPGEANSEADRRDAAKYRWLRERVEPAFPGKWAHYVGDWGTQGMDAAIDAAMRSGLSDQQS